jgi:hypothetical protein
MVMLDVVRFGMGERLEAALFILSLTSSLKRFQDVAEFRQPKPLKVGFVTSALPFSKLGGGGHLWVSNQEHSYKAIVRRDTDNYSSID